VWPAATTHTITITAAGGAGFELDAFTTAQN
jgi:hypothetical protein